MTPAAKITAHKDSRRATRPSAGLALASLMLLALAGFGGLAGCAKQQIGGGAPAVTRPGTSDISAAQDAFNAGNLPLAESIASNILLSGSADFTTQTRAWRIVTMAANAQNRPQAALRALNGWRELDPAAATDPEWRKAWVNTLGQLPSEEAAAMALAAASDKTAPWQLKLEANLFLAENRLRAGNIAGLPQELEALYAGAPDANARRNMEQRLFSQLHRSELGAVQELAGQVTESNEKYYPYALFRLEEARRLFLDEITKDLAKEMVAFMQEDTQLADRSLFRTWADPDTSVLERYLTGSASLALVLPMSGQYGNLADKIVQGAEIASRGLAGSGYAVRLHVIDSDQPGWLQEFAALPPEVQIVGGPLRLSDYQDLKNANRNGQRKIFAFLRALDSGDEGRVAWRFFSSDADQVAAVIRFAKNIGITEYATLIPNEDYGLRMLDSFRLEAARNGAGIRAESSYPAGEHQSWNKLVAEFLHTDKDAKHAPDTKFQALFLPDSWQNATIMMPHFFYYREKRLLFMGTMLWEQGISLQQRGETRLHNLIIFPGAWDPGAVSPAGMILRTAMASSGEAAPDFWVSLGYDFVSMAASLNLPAGASPADVNRSLSALGPIHWSGAPLSWDGAGQARQDLFVFTPADRGFTLADPARFRTYYTRAWSN